MVFGVGRDGGRGVLARHALLCELVESKSSPLLDEAFDEAAGNNDAAYIVA